MRRSSIVRRPPSAGRLPSTSARARHPAARRQRNPGRRWPSQLRVVVRAYWQNALTGSSRGVEVVVQRRDPARFSGGWSTRSGRLRYDDAARNESFWGDFDQRHTLGAYGQYRTSPTTSRRQATARQQLPDRRLLRAAGRRPFCRRQPQHSAPPRLRAARPSRQPYVQLRLAAVDAVCRSRQRAEPHQPGAGQRRVSGTGRAADFTDTMFPLLPSAGSHRFLRRVPRGPERPR